MHPDQNKWEHISERDLDILIDHLNTLNDTTPKVKCQGKEGVDPSIVMGIDSKLFQLGSFEHFNVPHHDEVQTVTIHDARQSIRPHISASHDDCMHTDHAHCDHAHDPEIVGRGSSTVAQDSTSSLLEETLAGALGMLSKETVWRVKGFVKLGAGYHILNWAFGRYELTPIDEVPEDVGDVKLTVMGERGEVKRAAQKLAQKLQADVV